MGNSQKSKFVDWIGTESDADIIPVKLTIKKSTCKNIYMDNKLNDELEDNMGVFAEEFIPANTYISKSNPNDVNEDCISRKINDLGYEGSAKFYEQNYEYVESKSNLVYVNVRDTFDLEGIINQKKPLTLIRTLRDIQPGEELSRHYGIDYWYGYEYDHKHKQCLSNNKLPSDYYFIDEYRIDLQYNHCLYIFGKFVDNKYYYVQSFGLAPSYYVKIDEFNKLPIFSSKADTDEYLDLTYGKYEDRNDIQRKEAWEFKYLIDISKSDNSKYEFEEPIIMKNVIKKDNIIEINNLKYYSTKYLKSKPTKYFDSQNELNDYIANTPKEEKSKYNLQVDYSSNTNVKQINL
jgi:hypothetical protein